MIMSIRSVFTYHVILTCCSLDGNLAHNATRPSLLNEAFFLMRSCISLFS